MWRLIRWCAALIVLGSIGCAAVIGYIYTQFVIPGPLAGDLVLIVPRGSGVDAIARLLRTSGVIADETAFRIGVRTLGREKPLLAGEYEFPKGVSAREAMEILQSGKTVVRRLTIPEGLTSQEILDRLSKTEGLFGSITIHPADGELLPETYHFSYGDQRDDLVKRMQAAMRDTLEDLWKRKPAGSPYETVRGLVTMASIVEKETARPDERPRVAGVFVNRLKIGMRLQSDPTVVYALTAGKTSFERALTRADLETVSPYNTYLNAGLPPGPIANPGRASLEAALKPAESGDLYFVADGSGGHAFARTLAEHNQNVARWRALMKNRPQRTNSGANE
jgi:UPF0755 protein